MNIRIHASIVIEKRWGRKALFYRRMSANEQKKKELEKSPVCIHQCSNDFGRDPQWVIKPWVFVGEQFIYIVSECHPTDYDRKRRSYIQVY